MGIPRKKKLWCHRADDLLFPLQICVLQGLSFVKARLLSMEIPAHVSDNLRDENTETESNTECLVKINPFRGSWGLRFLELELSNPTNVVFEISVFVQLEKSAKEDDSSPVQDSPEYVYPKTRIDRDYSARDPQPGSPSSSRHPSFSEKNTKAEINALIKNLTSNKKVRWQSGRNSSGELDIKDAIQTALQTTVMDVLLQDPLTFCFRLVRNGLETDYETKAQSPSSKGSVQSHEVTPMEVLVRNNTSEAIKLNLSVTCRDVAGQNCAEGADATVLWAGALSRISMEVAPLQEARHCFSLYFLVPGEYTMVAATVIEELTMYSEHEHEPHHQMYPSFVADRCGSRNSNN